MNMATILRNAGRGPQGRGQTILYQINPDADVDEFGVNAFECPDDRFLGFIGINAYKDHIEAVQLFDVAFGYVLAMRNDAAVHVAVFFCEVIDFQGTAP